MSKPADATTAPPEVAPAVRPTAVDGLLWLIWKLRWVLFGCVGLFYLAGFNGQWRVEPDSALYLSVARNLVEGRGYTYHGQPHDLAFPGLPWLMAGTFRLFGTGVLWPAHVVMLGFAAAGLGLAYRLFSLHTTARVAVLLTWALACTHFYFRYAFQLRNDLPFLVGVLACLAGYEAIFGGRSGGARERRSDEGGRWYDWGLLLGGVGLAAVMRPTMWVFVPVLLVSVGWAMRGRLRWPRVAGVGVVVLMLAGFMLLDPRGESGVRLGGYEEIALETMPRSAERLGANLLRVLDAAVVEVVLGIELEWTVLNAAAGLVIAGLAVGLLRVRLLWGLWVAGTLAMMLLMEPTARYLVAVLPLLLVGWWRGLAWLGGGHDGVRGPEAGGEGAGRTEAGGWASMVRECVARAGWREWAFAGLVMLWLGPNIGKNVGLVIEQRRAPFLAHYREGRFEPLVELAGALRREVPRGGYVIAPRGTGRVLTYYSDRWVVDAGELVGWQGPGGGLWVVQPLEAEAVGGEPVVEAFLKELAGRAGRPLVRIERRGGEPPLSLHYVFE